MTNLALPLTGSPSEPEADVTTYTISVIDLDEHDRDDGRHDDD